MENERTQNKLIFLTAISDAFRDEEDRELDIIGKATIPEDGDFTKVMTDLFYSFQTFFNMTTESEVDPVEFISILTRLIFQDQMEHGELSGGSLSDAQIREVMGMKPAPSENTK